MQHVNELFELTDLDPIRDSQEPEQEETRSQLNITHSSLISILSRYHIPEKVASHIRGQEQVFGSQPTYVKDGDHERLKAYGGQFTSPFEHNSAAVLIKVRLLVRHQSTSVLQRA